MTPTSSLSRRPAAAKKQAASVEFRNVTKRYGDVTAVDDVSFTIEPGKLVTLLGPSGCGKTTTLRMIAGLEMASEGQILIGGRDVTRLSAADRDVSMVFQSYALFPHMSVLENVAYGPIRAGPSRRRTRRRWRWRSSSSSACRASSGASPSELSGGQQQRVAVARALVLEPQVLLFDEPLSNLDAKLRRRVREDIRELQQNLNLTVAYVTHDQEEALAVSDRIIVMSNARIAQTGTPRELYEEPADLFVADFIGDANILSGELVEPSRPAWRRVRIGDLTRRPAAPGRRPGRREARRAPRRHLAGRGRGRDGSRRHRQQGVLSRDAGGIRGGKPRRGTVRGAVRQPGHRSRPARRSSISFAIRARRRDHPERLNPVRQDRTAPSSGMLRMVPQALQWTASRSCRCNPQAGQAKRTLLGRSRTWTRRRNSVTPQIMMMTEIRCPSVPGQGDVAEPGRGERRDREVERIDIVADMSGWSSAGSRRRSPS